MKTTVFNEYALNELKRLCIHNQEALEWIKRVEDRKPLPQISKKKQKKDKIPYSKIGNVLSEYAEEFRKELIIKQTKSERVFKKYLKSLNITHIFQRIVYCNNSFYIVDFFLPKENIVFEIDGGYHESVEQRIKDDFRTDNLIKSGINQIYRFTNKEVLNESETITRIKSICERY